MKSVLISERSTFLKFVFILIHSGVHDKHLFNTEKQLYFSVLKSCPFISCCAATNRSRIVELISTHLTNDLFENVFEAFHSLFVKVIIGLFQKKSKQEGVEDM